MLVGSKFRSPSYYTHSTRFGAQTTGLSIELLGAKIYDPSCSHIGVRGTKNTCPSFYVHQTFLNGYSTKVIYILTLPSISTAIWPFSWCVSWFCFCDVICTEAIKHKPQSGRITIQLHEEVEHCCMTCGFWSLYLKLQEKTLSRLSIKEKSIWWKAGDRQTSHYIVK